MLRRDVPAYVLLLSLVVGHLWADTPPLRDLDSHCPFSPPSSLEAWKARATQVKLQMQVSLGLLPKVELDPVQPKLYGKIDRDGYTIEKVTFESLPGFYVTGNLYRPSQINEDAKIPAVLCPHGHWTDARFYEASPREVKQLLASGAERFENAARHHIQARCVQLARMGCMVFHWDMIGYCDSQQISFDRAHRFGEQAKDSEVRDNGWLLFSPLAESHCQSILGLQTLAINRAVDMLLSLPEVDPSRIAITGASGGGTQSFVGAALDERISVAFPAVMVSTGMQGGCTCENACLLRTGTGNVEMAGLIAPRPLGLTAADDWTKTMPEDGFPQLQKLYGLFGAENNVALFPAIHFGHNFNHVSRVAMYGWINDHFGLGFEKPILEHDFEPALRDELTVWDDDHPQPAGGEDFERELMKLWAELVDSHMRGLLSGDQRQVAELAGLLSDGWRASLGLTTTTLEAARVEELADGGIELRSGQLPAWRLYTKLPKATSPADQPVASQPAAEGNENHHAILAPWTPTEDDLHFALPGEAGEQSLFFPILAGEWANPEPDSDHAFERVKLQELVKNPRLAAAYTYGYNLPLFAQRAQQVGLTIQWLATQNAGQPITIVGRGSDAALAAAGACVAQELARQAGSPPVEVVLKLQPADFSFAAVDSIRSPNFLPGSARYWDLPGLLACVAARIEIESDTPQQYEQYSDLISLSGGSFSVTSGQNVTNEPNATDAP